MAINNLHTSSVFYIKHRYVVLAKRAWRHVCLCSMYMTCEQCSDVVPLSCDHTAASMRTKAALAVILPACSHAQHNLVYRTHKSITGPLRYPMSVSKCNEFISSWALECSAFSTS
jgi:hypothetical protein